MSASDSTADRTNAGRGGRLRRFGADHTWLLVVAVVVLLLAAWNVWWVARYRQGYPFTIDEAGYIAIGIVDHIGLQTGGLHGWWEAIQNQVPQAPLLPALTSFTLIFKSGTLNAFGVLIACMMLLAFAAYGIGSRLAGPRLGALAAVVVATLPGTIVFTREYVFAMGVAAFLSCAVFSLLRSDGLRSYRWSLACGVSIGLMLLSRSMTIAFVPGLLLAGVVVALVRGWLQGEGDIRRRAISLGIIVVSGFGLAATWYVRNFTPVYEYLTSFGYGSQSTYYGAEHSWLSWGRWHQVASRMVQIDLLVPLGVAIFLGLVVMAVVVVRRVVDAPDRRSELTTLAGTDAFSVALVFACCYLALTSSRNVGEGFTIPVVALLPPLAVMSLRHLNRRVVAPALAVVAAATVLNLLSNSNVSDSLAKTRSVHVPAFGTLAWVNGVPHAVSAMRAQLPGPESRFDAVDHEWEVAGNELAGYVQKVVSEGAAHEPVAFGSRNEALNTSTLLLDGLADFDRPYTLWQLEPEPDTPASYVRQLEESGAGILVTMSSEEGDYVPVVTQAYVEAAARRLGFRITRRSQMPDGRQMRVWLAPSE
jgi:hypothetical protein